MNLTAVETVGTIGGSMIALSLLPQVVYTYKTKSAGDISYTYQGIYIMGTTLVNTYAIILGLWPVYIPCLIEESLIVSLTVMKLLYDRNDRHDTELDTYRSIRWSARSTRSFRRLSETWKDSSGREDLATSGRSSTRNLDEINASWRWGRSPPSSATKKDGVAKTEKITKLKDTSGSTREMTNHDIENGDVEKGGGMTQLQGQINFRRHSTEISGTTGSRLDAIATAVGDFFHGENVMVQGWGKANVRKRHSWTL